MSRSPRGMCCIINNARFSEERFDRPEAVHDERALVNLFEELSFEVHVKRDLKFDEMRKVAIEFSKMDHSEADAFVMIIMSRGDSPDMVYGAHLGKVRVEDLTSMFTASKCQTLKEKPKIFFMQTCRGSKEDSCVRKLVIDSALPKSTCPREADFLVAFGTSAGYVALRNDKHGSLFIQVSLIM